ncbi:ATP-dependent DNA helicase UvrD2 [Iamia sp. SCSIO 61187]|uniref:ATP-dependent DNA helicase UvrD2 n=1 Tax=Iamia sp. SCSIO 61187 TaxID=2722752 RepID=UPI001C63A29B|nr:ATP-dependent DNA helicase UvrD2 [Iamia sp. SCSIO 61187]QYG94584.1 ATP-dependent DNA helicase UvrD2 [Iamia sp. SCSIO 61187]
MSHPSPGPFGRSVVIDGGQTAPAAWADAPVVVVDEAVLAAPGGVVAQLHAAWAERRPVVVELRVDPSRFREPVPVVGTPWDLGVDVDCPLDRLHFLVWAASWDARPAEPVWWWGVKAARLADGARATPEGPADLLLADGTPLWVDGGPRQPFAPEVVGGFGVVHRESVEVGRLAVAPPPVAPSTDLAPDQMAAVAHERGPARIVAPAGSGKTRVLTERLRHLIADRGWEPGSPLAVAYNVKARDEMVERTDGLGARVQTLNGLAYAVLARQRGGAPPVIDEREVRRLLDGLLPKRRRQANTDPVAPYLEALTEVRLGLRSPREVEEERGDVPGFAGIVDPYREELARRGVVDFDEQICAAIEALLTDGELRRDVQSRHRHLLVDELQDLTPAHVVLVRLVAGPPLDVFGVGDDDQVIYGHAGADPRFLIDFATWFPGGGEHALEVNHRCAAPIVEAAATLLSYNHRRVAKEIRPRPDADVSPDAFRIVGHDPSGGAGALVAAVQGWIDEGRPLGDIAVLTRVHALLLAPVVALAEAQIPVRATVGTELLDRTGARAALAYLRIAADPTAIRPEDLAEVYRRPSRRLPQWITKWFRRSMTVAEVAAIATRIDDVKVADKIATLAADLGIVASAGTGTTRQALEVIRDRIGLGEAMEGLDRSKGGEGSSQLDDLEALIQVADLHPELDGFEPWLRRALGQASPRGPAVTLSTVHRVKGREWPCVVVAGVTAGLLPHRLAADEEEERRVLHVAITRGRSRVVVLGDESRPSPFLAELTGDAPRRAAPSPIVRTTAPAATAKGRSEGGRAPKGDPLEGEAGEREERLKAWRRERSRADGVPAYVVASDATLRAIAQRAPTSSRELASVPGIGPSKLQKYGDEILALTSPE